VSLGIAVSAADHLLTAESLYSRADEALYRAKRGGRNRVECAPALMQQVGTWAAEN
jgi:GGDEF domain-containing protein